jgi:hypothetical protein
MYTSGLTGLFDYLGWVSWVILAAVVLFPLFFMLLSRMEKQMIHCFEPCDEGDILQQSDYTKAMNKAAEELGFTFCSWFRHSRGGIYKATVTTWISPDSLIMLVVGGGKIAGINLKTTFLYSKSSNGYVLVTADEAGEYDLSGVFDKQVLWNANLNELYDLHLSRLEIWDEPLEPFDGSSVLQEYEVLQKRRVQMLVDMGLARYLDFDQNQWRYTIKGAIQMYTRGYKTSLKDAKEQKDRFSSSIKRPGSG